MKAEQRKELETNTLADKMGQTMQRVKAGSRRTALLYFVGMLVLAVGLFLTYRWYSLSTQETSEQWLKLYDGGPRFLLNLATTDKDTPAGKAARLQILWLKYWEEGIQMIGTDRDRIKSFKSLEEEYKKTIEICKDDPLFEPQAMLGQAVVVESMALQDATNLDRAKKLYEDLADKHGTTAEGKYARERFEMLKDAKKFVEMRAVYGELQVLLNVPAADRPMLPPLMPDFDFDPKKVPDR